MACLGNVRRKYQLTIICTTGKTIIILLLHCTISFVTSQPLYTIIIDKLRLKIPWKNLYSAPVIAEVDGLYILAGPAAGKQ